MNVDTLIKWGTDSLHLLNEPDHIQCLGCSKDYFTEKFGWLDEFRDDIHRWNDVVTIVKEAEMFIKFQGFYRGCHNDLKALPTYNALTFQGKRIKSELIEFIKQESSKAPKNERLLGSSEVIESVFGKMKRLEQDQSKNGFTVFILGLAAIVAETTSDVVQKALETVKTSAVNEWFKKNIGRSVQAKRVEVNRLIKNRIQNQEQFCIE